MAIVRARHSAVYPHALHARRATNPAPAAMRASATAAAAAAAELARHRRRLSGPLLDRIDLLSRFTATPAERRPPIELRAGARAVARRPASARRRGSAGRACGSTPSMDARMLAGTCGSTSAAESLLDGARRQGLLSARGEHRMLRVARTIADLAGSERVRAADVGGALALRCETRRRERRRREDRLRRPALRRCRLLRELGPLLDYRSARPRSPRRAARLGGRGADRGAGRAPPEPRCANGTRAPGRPRRCEPPATGSRSAATTSAYPRPSRATAAPAVLTCSAAPSACELLAAPGGGVPGLSRGQRLRDARWRAASRRGLAAAGRDGRGGPGWADRSRGARGRAEARRARWRFSADGLAAARRARRDRAQRARAEWRLRRLGAAVAVPGRRWGPVACGRIVAGARLR